VDHFRTVFRIEAIINVTSVAYPCSRIARYSWLYGCS